MDLEVKTLYECPEHFTAVGHWIYEQWWRTPDNTPEVLLNILRAHIESDVFPFTIVAILDAEPVGSCCVIENDCPLRPQYAPWVAAVFVKKEKRRRGIASAILQKAVQVAEKLQIKGLYIDCWAKTAPLYEKSGWAVWEKDVGKKDSWVMYRSIGNAPLADHLS